MDREDMAATGVDATTLKACCATLYQSDLARKLLGDSFHPGGMALTEHLGHLLRLAPGVRVLDVAAGTGASAIFLAERFGCEVVGIDFSAASVAAAIGAANARKVAHLARFEQGDAECLSFPAHAFDAIICECAFCTFPDKAASASEFQRVLRPGGSVGLSDLTRHGDATPPDLQDLFAWLACIGAAQPIDAYRHYLSDAGLRVDAVEAHDEALVELVQSMRTRLVGAELLMKLRHIELPGVDFERVRVVARAASGAVRDGLFGYAIVTATK